MKDGGFQAMGKPIVTLPAKNGELELTVAECIICGVRTINMGSNKHCVCPHCKECIDNGNKVVLELLSKEDNCLTVGRVMMLPEDMVESPSRFVALCNTKEYDELFKLWQAENG